MEEMLIGFEEIWGSHTWTNMAGIINYVLARYWISPAIVPAITER